MGSFIFAKESEEMRLVVGSSHLIQRLTVWEAAVTSPIDKSADPGDYRIDSKD